MELAPYLDGLRRDLAAAAAPGGDDVARAADLLGGSLESSARMCLLEALSDAAAEITTKLDGGSVEVRLRGREAQFVVTAGREPGAAVAAPVAGTGPAAPAVATAGGDDSPGSPCGCPRASRTRSNAPPPPSRSRSTPGWSARSRRCSPAPPASRHRSRPVPPDRRSHPGAADSAAG